MPHADPPDRAGQGRLGPRLQLGSVVPQVEESNGQQDDSDRAQGNRRGLSQFRCLFAEIPTAKSVHRGPDDAAGRIEDEEAPPGHAVHAGEERGQGAQDRDEASEEDDLAAVAQKQVLA